MRTKLITVLLALFLGGLGFHRMYLGQKLIGFLYLIFCWTFIPGIIALVECFYFAFMKQETFDNAYNLDYILKKKQLENLNLNK